MRYTSFKISSAEVNELKKITGEKTGTRAIEKIISHYLNVSNQKNIIKALQSASFHKDFDPIRNRKNER